MSKENLYIDLLYNSFVLFFCDVLNYRQRDRIESFFCLTFGVYFSEKMRTGDNFFA